MARAKVGDTVDVHYTGRLEDGSIFDSSLNREPLEFTIGEHQVIPGFEEAVIDLEPGDQKTVTIVPEQAYGEYREDMTANFDRGKFPAEMEIKKGDRLQLRTSEGHPMAVEVTDVNESEVTLNANHPLAGKTLIFDVQLVEIKS